jgi:polar amino acid transport system permease protein
MDSIALFQHYGPSLVHGFMVTVGCWAGGCGLGLVVGLLAAVARTGGPLWLRIVVRAYVEVIRGTPLLVQLFLLYAGGPYIGLRLEPVAAGVVGLGVYSSAYFAEIFRGGFMAVPKGLVEAADSLGFAPSVILRRIILPVMLAAVLPSLVNMAILLTKETVVLSIITVPELMYEMQTMAAETFATFEVILAMAVFYWILVEAISHLGLKAEARVTRFLVRSKGARV